MLESTFALAAGEFAGGDAVEEKMKAHLRTVSALAGLILAQAVLAQGPRGEGGPVYIAGEGFSLEQAIADAARENAGADRARFAVVAIGAEVAKLTLRGASSDVRESVRRTQDAGGIFYLCERDVKAARLPRGDLLPRVRVARGWTKAETEANGSAAKALSPIARRIRRICTGPN